MTAGVATSVGTSGESASRTVPSASDAMPSVVAMVDTMW